MWYGTVTLYGQEFVVDVVWRVSRTLLFRLAGWFMLWYERIMQISEIHENDTKYYREIFERNEILQRNFINCREN